MPKYYIFTFKKNKSMKKTAVLIIALSILILGCKKKEISLDQINTPLLEPSFALPIGYARLNLGNIDNTYDTRDVINIGSSGFFEIVQKERVFELTSKQLINLPIQNYSNDYSMPNSNQTNFIAGGNGFTTSYSEISTINFIVPFSEQLDSVVLDTGSLNINLSSDFMHSVAVNITIPSLYKNGVVLQQNLDLIYSNSLPTQANAFIDISGYTLDLSDGGTTDNTFKAILTFTVTNSGNTLVGNEKVTMDTELIADDFQIIWGYLGQRTNFLNLDSTKIDLLPDIPEALIHFEDPQINITIGNPTGVDVLPNFFLSYIPNNGSSINLGGPGFSSFPIIEKANNPGEIKLTTHTINNNNTTPSLSSIMDQFPGQLNYSSLGTSNPGGFTNNFALGDDLIWCDAEVVLPLYGWINNFNLLDTTDLDVADVLGIDSASNLTVEDIEQVMLRIIVDNGLPIEAGVQLYFANANHVIIDSLFQNANEVENVFENGIVDFSLPLSDPNHGKVVQSTRKITDVIISQALISKLIDGNAMKLIYKVKGLTNDAISGQNVKIFPEYNVDIKVSAKVDFKIDLED